MPSDIDLSCRLGRPRRLAQCGIELSLFAEDAGLSQIATQVAIGARAIITTEPGCTSSYLLSARP